MVKFAAAGVAYAVNSDGIPFITALGRETTVNIVRLFKKVAETAALRAKGTTMLELFVHFWCLQTLCLTGPTKQHGP